MSIHKRQILALPSELDAWRKEYEAILRYIYEHDTLSYEEIARQIGVSKSAVLRVAKMANLSRRRGRKSSAYDTGLDS